MDNNRRYIPETPDDIFHSGQTQNLGPLQSYAKASRASSEGDNFDSHDDGRGKSVNAQKVFAEHSLFIRALVHRLTEVRKASKLWLKEGAATSLYHLLSIEKESVTVDVLRRANAATIRGKPLDENVGNIRNLLEELNVGEDDSESKNAAQNNNRLQLPLTPPGAFPVWPFRTETAGCTPSELLNIKSTSATAAMEQQDVSEMYDMASTNNTAGNDEETSFAEDVVEFNRQTELDHQQITSADVDIIDLVQFEGCVSWMEYVVRLVSELLSSPFEDFVLVGLSTANVIASSVINRLVQQVISYSNKDIEIASMLLEKAVQSADVADNDDEENGKESKDEDSSSTDTTIPLSVCRNIHQLRVCWVYLDRLDEPLQKCRGYGGQVLQQVNEILEKLRQSRQKVQHLLWTISG